MSALHISVALTVGYSPLRCTRSRQVITVYTTPTRPYSMNFSVVFFWMYSCQTAFTGANIWECLQGRRAKDLTLHEAPGRAELQLRRRLSLQPPPRRRLCHPDPASSAPPAACGKYEAPERLAQWTASHRLKVITVLTGCLKNRLKWSVETQCALPSCAAKPCQMVPPFWPFHWTPHQQQPVHPQFVLDNLRHSRHIKAD